MKATAYLAAVLLLLACITSSRADDAVPGHAVLAQPDGDALVIWNASQVVASIVRSKMSDAEADGLLEHDAIRVLAKMAPSVSKNAKTITVRVIYAKSGEVSPIYGTPTFKGFEQYALLVARARELALDKTAWGDQSGKQTAPNWVVYKIVGRLPPRL